MWFEQETNLSPEIVGFYDLLERDDEVMADRSFQIQEICFFIFADWLFHLVQE